MSEKKDTRLPFMSDQYIDIHGLLSIVKKGMSDLVADFQDGNTIDPETKAIVMVVSSAFVLHATTQINIARSLERIAWIMGGQK